jgi:hypothetical protein
LLGQLFQSSIFYDLYPHKYHTLKPDLAIIIIKTPINDHPKFKKIPRSDTNIFFFITTIPNKIPIIGTIILKYDNNITKKFTSKLKKLSNINNTPQNIKDKKQPKRKTKQEING